MKTITFVLQYARKYVRTLSVTVASMILLVGVQLLAPWIIRTMIAAVTDQTAGSSSADLVTQLALLALLVFVGRAGLQFLRSYMAHVAGWSVVADVRRDVYERLLHLSLRFHADQQTGQVMSRVVNDVGLLEQLIAHAVPDMIVNVLTLVGVIVVLTTMNVQLMLLSLFPVPIIVLLMRGYARYVRPAFRERQVDLGELNAALNDSLSGIREIKAFTQEATEAERVSYHIFRFRDSTLNALRLMATFHPLVEFSAALGTIVLIYFGGQLALKQVLPVEDLVAFFLYLELLYQPVRALSGVWEQVQEATAGAERVAELMIEHDDVLERPGAITFPGRAKGNISFRDVSFRYDRGEPVLEHLNLDIPAGSVVALVGPTGVGKTTLINLIPRFYDVCSGSITLDGYDLRDLTLKSLRQQISVVLQDVFLISRHGARKHPLWSPGRHRARSYRGGQDR